MKENFRTQISRLLYDEIYVCSQCGGGLFQQFGTHRCSKCKANNMVKRVSIHDELDIGQLTYLDDIIGLLGEHYEKIVDSFSKEVIFFSNGDCQYHHRARLRWIKTGIGKQKIVNDFMDASICFQYNAPIPFDLARAIVSAYRGGSLPKRNPKKRYKKDNNRVVRDSSYEFPARRFVIDMCKCRDLDILEGPLYDTYEEIIDDKELRKEINEIRMNRSKKIYTENIPNIIKQLKKQRG